MRRGVLVLLTLLLLAAAAGLVSWVVSWEAAPAPSAAPRSGPTEPPPPTAPSVPPQEREPPADDVGEGDRVVQSTVVDSAGDPAADVRVELLRDGAPILTTRTDANGRFVFEGVRGRSVTVRIEGPHHRPTTRSLRTVASTDRSGDPTEPIALGRDLRHLVRITTEDGSTPPGAHVAVYSLRRQVLDELRADETGLVAWVQQHDDPVTLYAMAEGHVPKRFSVHRTGELVEVVLGTSHSLRGRVVDRLGRPVVNALVDVRTHAHPEGLRTDSEGRFRFDDLAPTARLGVIVQVEGHGPTLATVSTGDEEVVITAPDHRKVTIRVKLRLPDGALAKSLDGAPGPSTDSRGWLIDERIVPVDQTELRLGWGLDPVQMPGIETPWRQYHAGALLQLAPDRDDYELELTLTRKPIAYLPVRVEDSKGRPVSGLQLEAENGARTVTDADGRALFVFAHGDPGIVRVTSPMTRDLQLTAASRPAHDGEPDRIVLDLPPPTRVTLRGEGIDEITRVTWTPLTGLHGTPSQGTAEPVGSDDNAKTRTFELGVLPAEPILVATFAPGGRSSFHRIEDPTSAKGRHVLDLHGGVALELRVVDATGQPRRSGRVLATALPASGFGRKRVGYAERVDDDRLRFGQLPPMDTEILIVESRQVVALQRVSLREAVNRATVTVHDRIPVEGRVVGPDGDPLLDCELRLLIPGGYPLASSFGLLGRTNVEGRFRLDVPDIPGAALGLTRYDRTTVLLEIDRKLPQRARQITLEPIATVRVSDDTFVGWARPAGSDLPFEPRLSSDGPYQDLRLSLPAGRVELLLSDPIGRTRSRTIDVTPGTVIDLRDE